MFKKTQTDLERMLGKYLLDAATGCLNWTGRLDKDGYAARVKMGSRTDGSRREVRPHRWMFEQANGQLNSSLVPDHLCRNRRCGNAAHMEAVTPKVNHERGLAARALTCPNGHEISGSNEILRRGGHRCRICHNEYMAKWQRSTGHKNSAAYRQRQRENENRCG